ncbi:hypothetical protein ACFTAO_41870 [Paenibacillus rhizoplanae]
MNKFMDKGQQMADTAKEFITPKSPKNIPGGSTGVLGSQNGSLNNVNKVGEVGKINEKGRYLQ